MQAQFLPNGYQSPDLRGIWGCDPILPMVLTFIIVPIGLAILCIALDSIGRILRGNASSRSNVRLAKNRFEVAQQPQTVVRLEWRRRTLRHPKANGVREFPRRHRWGARRPRER
jgi:hypothetical protein